eukprot:TRINITY_DN13910_c0_g1_i1.p2 TRINITY_DN13910_c0_g1~~TRINITY_DN13910_c0_g1_i1.p2  ORF type:complete len:144 (+),score=25.99 TRINITY_DN13910_c0_g1_i1:293-724(+)
MSLACTKHAEVRLLPCSGHDRRGQELQAEAQRASVLEHQVCQPSTSLTVHLTQVEELAASLSETKCQIGKQTGILTQAAVEERVAFEKQRADAAVVELNSTQRQVHALREQYDVLVTELKNEIHDLEDELSAAYNTRDCTEGQ